MELPIACRMTLETILAQSKIPTPVLRDTAAQMTVSYQERSGHGARLVTKEAEVLAYAVTRMPATFGAVAASLTQTLSALSADDVNSLHTVLDLGAGTGAASLAISALLPQIAEITAVEREPQMITLGKNLTADIPAVWQQADVTEAVQALTKQGIMYDIVIASYMTNEMTDAGRAALFPLLWQLTRGILLLVEPGTKVGSAILRAARVPFVSYGARIAAPCPEIVCCPLSEDDWCHFTCRVARTKLHKQLKGGDVPYEDEKFSYLALSRLPVLPCRARVLRHPIKEAGRITLTLCTPNGWKQDVVTKRSKTAFVAARKANAGDAFAPDTDITQI